MEKFSTLSGIISISFRHFSMVTIASFLTFGCGQPYDSSSSIQERWDSANDPLRLGSGYERVYSKLPPAAELSNTPWADSYWPTYKGGISYRSLDNPSKSDYSWKYKTYNLKQLKRMSEEDLGKLSPAEKLDIINNDFNYPVLTKERKRTSPSTERWQGLCHGWAAAALTFDEPAPIIYQAKNGLNIPLGSSDIKAMITYNQANYNDRVSNRPQFLGLRCDVDLEKNPSRANDPDCKGVNAGSFHLILTNFIGIRHKGFVADVSRGYAIWNHPIFGYKTKVLKETLGASANAAPGTVKEVEVETQMTYRVESSPTWEMTNYDDEYSFPKTYQYILELNSQDEIIGGTWLVEDRPSFFWTENAASFTDKNTKIVKEIYEIATGKRTQPDLSAAPAKVSWREKFVNFFRRHFGSRSTR